MYSRDAIGFAGDFALVLAVLLAGLYLLFNARNAAAHLVAFFIIFLPLMNSPYLPGQVFGIRGLSPVNLLTVLAFVAIFFKIDLSGRMYGYLVRFLNFPLAICILVFMLCACMTLFAGDDHLYYQGPSGVISYRPSKLEFLLYECIRPLQIMLVGLLVFVACDITGSKRLFQRALLVAPIVLTSVAILFSLEGGLDNYRASRAALGVRMGMHGNGFGAISVYYLIAAIAMRGHDWPRTRYVAILFSLMGIVLSYSRIAWLAAGVLLVVLFFRLNAREKAMLAGIGFAVFVVFAGQIISRAQYGVSSDPMGGADWNVISAGRTEDLWIPAWRQFLQQPILGYGIGMLVDSPSVGRWLPHSSYFSVLLNGGLIAALAFLNLFYWAIRRSLKIGDETVYFILAMSILGLTGHSFYPSLSNFVLWVIYGMALHSKYRVREPVAQDSGPRGIADLPEPERVAELK